MIDPLGTVIPLLSKARANNLFRLERKREAARGGALWRGLPHGFTLVELLGVIVLTAILVSLLLPTVGKIMEKGREAKCTANLRQIGAAMAAYASDNNGEILPGAKVFTFDGDPTPHSFFWSDLLAPYTGIDMWSNGTYGTRPNGIFACPSSKGLCNPGGRSDYALNFLVNGDGNAPFQYRMGSLPNPSKILALADAAWMVADELELLRIISPGLGDYAGIWPRHGSGTLETGRFNGLFYDGHVESLTLNDIPLTGNAWQELPWNPQAVE